MRSLPRACTLLMATATCGAPDSAMEADEGEDDGEFVQPGLDDPTARQWEKAGGWYPEDPHALDDAIAELIEGVQAALPGAVAPVRLYRRGSVRRGARARRPLLLRQP